MQIIYSKELKSISCGSWRRKCEQDLKNIQSEQHLREAKESMLIWTCPSNAGEAEGNPPVIAELKNPPNQNCKT